MPVNAPPPMPANAMMPSPMPVNAPPPPNSEGLPPAPPI
jgi:hypothetical protein